jgi:uncharacterized protein (DUF1501 family)
MNISWFSRFLRGWSMSPAEPHTEVTEDSVSRRQFLRAGSLSVVGLSLAEHAAWADFLHRSGRKSCILVLMTGGPSQLDTFDPKPDASADYRGTLSAISTSVTGTLLSETLPNLAQRAHRFSLLRSIHHTAASIHETGLQLLQTGRLSWKGVRFPHVGHVLAEATGAAATQPSAVLLPRPLESTGLSAYAGQEAHDDDRLVRHVAEAAKSESDAIRRQYGASRFGELLLQSRLLVEQGVRCITVNLFDQLGPYVTWDAHGDAESGPATIANCRDQLCPAFDRALSGLLDDLSQRGLLDETLVLAVGEMGRTPRINPHGGRDHWTKCWSALVAGGGTPGGQVIGASDETGSEPVDRPIALGELPATLLHWFGIDGRELKAVVGQKELPLVPHAPLHELWGTAPVEMARTTCESTVPA